MHLIDQSSLIVGLIFLVFTLIMFVTYDLIFETVNSVSSGRSISLIGFKVFALPVRSMLKELSYYSISGILSISAYLLVIMSIFFCSIYYLTCSSEVNLPFLIYPMSISFILIFLCRGLSFKEDTIVSKAYQSIYVLIFCFSLMIISFIMLASVLPDFSILSVMNINIPTAEFWKIAPAAILFVVSSYFILDEVRFKDEPMCSASLIGKFIYYLLLLHLSSMFLTVIMYPFIQSFSKLSVGQLAESANTSFIDNVLLYSFSENFFVFGPLKLIIVWALFAFIAFSVSWIHSLLPRMNMRTRIFTILKLSVPLIIINLAVVLLL